MPKMQRGIRKACEKRNVSAETIESMALEVEGRVQQMGEQEVSARLIGDLVMDALKKVDEVAYVRFASVYRQFKDIGTFKEELDRLLDEK